MTKIISKLGDVVEAQAALNNMSIDADGNVKIQLQKVLVDDTTGESENDGDPVDVELTATEEQSIIDALAAPLAAIAARVFAPTSAAGKGL
jgi:hypothetical protein